MSVFYYNFFLIYENNIHTDLVKILTSTLDADSTKVSTICFPMVPLTTLPENQAQDLTTLQQMKYTGSRFHSYFYKKSQSNDKKLDLQDSVTPCKLHTEHYNVLNHKLLLEKLFYCGRRGSTNLWFRSYLTHRKQFI